MARVPYLEKTDLSAENQDLLKRRINLFQALVNSPNAARAFSGLGQFIRFGSKLDPRLRELAILQVGWLARSPYEWSHHVKLGRDFGVGDDDIRALIDDTAGRPTKLDPMAKSVLLAAREMTAGGAMSDATFASLQAALGNDRWWTLQSPSPSTTRWCACWRHCRSTSRRTICRICGNSRCPPKGDRA